MSEEHLELEPLFGGHSKETLRRLFRPDNACFESAIIQDLLAALEKSEAQHKDAERYRWLRGKMGFTQAPGKPVVMSLCGSIPAPNHNMNADWVGDRFDASVDEAIDAARAKEQP